MLLHDNPLPLYHQLAQLLREQIEQGYIEYGEKLESEAEMMERYGIGRLTVRSALSQLVNLGYLKKLHGKGTFCCYMPAQPERKTIDVLLDMGDQYFVPYYLKSIARVLDESNYNMRVSDTKNSSHEISALLNRTLHNESSGVIFQPSHHTFDMPDELVDNFRRANEAHMPLVMIDSAYPIKGASSLQLDEIEGGRIAATHLLSLGHVRAALVYMEGFQDSLLRREGFLEVYQRERQPKPLEYIYQRGGFEPVLRDLQAGLFTAIFCYNDDMAVNFLRLLKEHGICVPDDVSLMGFDDSVLAPTTEPALTTISHPKQLLGEEAARVLIEFIDERRRPPYERLFSPSLTIRSSCAARTDR